jgi:cellulose synthase/poly-beta-1,6-N-acetylglucosamine synthase-like glycosyltransferase
MEKQIESILIKVDEGTMPVQQALSELLRLFNVSGEVCDNCGEGKPIICAKCYEIESNFRESY